MAEYLDETRWPHIFLYEIACRCRRSDCKYKTLSQVLQTIDFEILDDFEVIRDSMGHPLQITSGIRCPKHNRAIGGARYSPHVPHDVGGGRKQSYAIDFLHGTTQSKARDNVRSFFAWIRIGWKRYSNFLHIDRAYKYPKKNATMKKNWRKGVEW